MNSKTMTAILAAAGMALPSASFAAVPQVTGVTMTQATSSRLVTIEYTLADAPAVVTLDVQTNANTSASAEDPGWTSIGGEAICNAQGDVWKQVTAGARTITWCLYVSLALLAYLLYLTIHEYLGSRLQEILIPMLSIVMILVAIWLDGKTPEGALMISYLTIAMSVSSVLYYIWLHHQFVLEHEEDLKAQQRIQIMMSQIQPHFLYNTLSAIQVLCHTNPEKAADITEDFGSYLRQNLAFLNNSGLIPFQKELEHTKTYAEIEETRFPNIRVTYDIQDSTFSLPSLTLQPIVENAIRHGVRIREEGVVTVSTRKEKEWHLLEIRDNGTGFDVNMLDTADDSHIGLRNVRSRIESMCNGTLTVQSLIDEGTTVMIQIPDNSEEADPI